MRFVRIAYNMRKKITQVIRRKAPIGQLSEHKERLQRLHRHPFIVPVVTFLVLFFLSAAGFVFAGGTTIGPDDSHIVQLYVDGSQKVLPSRAATVGEFLQKSNIKIGANDVVEPVTATPITDNNFSVNVYRAKAVTIIDKGGNEQKPTSVTTYSAQQTPALIAKAAGYTVYPEDKVSVQSSDEALQNGIINQQVVIQRSVPLSIYLYDKQVTSRTLGKTVAQVLAEKKIKPLATDTVMPALNTPVTPDMQIYLTSKGQQIITQTEDIEMPTQTVNDPTVNLGTTTVTTPGSPGKKAVTYQLITNPDGSIGHKQLQEVILSQPVTQIVSKGTKLVAMPIGGDKGAILSAAGVAAGQQSAADFIISRESGWNLTAHNSGGCLGLGQACPGGKLTNACPNWQSDAICQVQFFGGYANGHYGSWQNAQVFWLANHWW
jgi:uncharacterized protein YabE (DUF348 family)